MRSLIAALLLLALSGAACAADDVADLVGRLTGDVSAERYAAYNKLRIAKDVPKVIALLPKALPASAELGQYYGVMILQQHFEEGGRRALEGLKGAKSAHLRVLAAAALHRRGERDVEAVIVKALRASSDDERLLGLLLMRVYSLRGSTIQEEIRKILTGEHGTAVLEPAIYGVYLVRDKAALGSLEGLFEHENGGIRAMAAACALLLGSGAATPVLVEAIEDGGVGSSQLYKVKNLLAQAAPVPARVLAAVHHRLDGETSAYTLRTLIQILGDHGYAQAAQSIRAHLDHRDASVSKAAFSALARFPGALSPETVRGLLEGGSDARKLAAVDTLRRSDDFSGRDVALKILREGEQDKDRWEAASVLGKFRHEDVVEPLLDALMDDSLTVRANAYNSLGAVLRGLFPYRRIDLTTTGYTTSSPRAARKRAASRLRSWWRARRADDW